MQRATLPKVMLLPTVVYPMTEQCRNVKAQPLSPSCDILTPELPMGLATANAGSVLSSTSSPQSSFLPFPFGRCPSQSHSWRNTLRAKLFCLRITFQGTRWQKVRCVDFHQRPLQNVEEESGVWDLGKTHQAGIGKRAEEQGQ